MFLCQHCNSWSNVWRNCLQVFTSFCKKPGSAQLAKTPTMFLRPFFCFRWWTNGLMQTKQKKTWHRGTVCWKMICDSMELSELDNLSERKMRFASLEPQNVRFRDDMATRCGDLAFPTYFLGFPPNSRKKHLYYIQSGKLTWQKSIKSSLKKEHLGSLPSTSIDSAPCFNNYHHVVLNGCGSKSLNPKAMVEILPALVTNMSPPNGPFEKVVPFPKVGYVWICYFPGEPIPGWFLEEWSSRRLVRHVFSSSKNHASLREWCMKLVKQKGETKHVAAVT